VCYNLSNEIHHLPIGEDPSALDSQGERVPIFLYPENTTRSVKC
jgi:hypothetical protein